MTINLPGAHRVQINEPGQDHIYFSPLSLRCLKNIPSLRLLSLEGLSIPVWFTCHWHQQVSLSLSCVVIRVPIIKMEPADLFCLLVDHQTEPRVTVQTIWAPLRCDASLLDSSWSLLLRD